MDIYQPIMDTLVLAISTECTLALLPVSHIVPLKNTSPSSIQLLEESFKNVKSGQIVPLLEGFQWFSICLRPKSKLPAKPQKTEGDLVADPTYDFTSYLFHHHHHVPVILTILVSPKCAFRAFMCPLCLNSIHQDITQLAPPCQSDLSSTSHFPSFKHPK